MVLRLVGSLHGDFEAWARLVMSEPRIRYLFLDGVVMMDASQVSPIGFGLHFWTPSGPNRDTQLRSAADIAQKQAS